MWGHPYKEEMATPDQKVCASFCLDLRFTPSIARAGIDLGLDVILPKYRPLNRTRRRFYLPPNSTSGPVAIDYCEYHGQT